MLIKIVKKYWKENTFAFFLTCIESAGIIASTVLLANIMNSLINLKFYDFLFFLIGSLLAWGVALLFGFIRMRYTEKIKQNQLIEMKQEILTKIENSSFQKFHERNTNEYISWMTNDINLIEEQGFGNLYNGMSSATLLLFSAIAILNFHWILLMVSLVLSICLFVIPKFLKQKLDAKNKSVSRSFEKYSSKIDEWIKGFDTLYSYNKTTLLSSKLQHSIEKVKQEKINLKQEKINLYTLVRMTSVLAQYAIILITGGMIFLNYISPGSIFAIGDLTGNFFGNTSFFIDEITNFVSAASISEKFDIFYATESSEKVEDGSFEFKSTIIVENVIYSFNEDTQISIPNMVFKKGKKYAIVGKSGSGKSTFLNILVKNYTNFDGNISVDKKKIQDINTKELKKHIGYVTQKNYVFDLSLEDNIVLESDYPKNKVDEIITYLDLNEKKHLTNLGIHGENLSGGQAQRVELARGLVHAKDLLIIDEGTSSLDRKTAVLIEEYILSNPDLTVIFVTHHLSNTVKKYFERIYSF